MDTQKKAWVEALANPDRVSTPPWHRTDGAYCALGAALAITEAQRPTRRWTRRDEVCLRLREAWRVLRRGMED